MSLRENHNVFAKTFRCIAVAGCLLAVWGARLEAQVPVGIPTISVVAGSVVRIPVNVGDLTGKDVTSFEFVVSCDTNVVRFTGVDQENTLSVGMLLFANNRVRPYGPGKMKVACAGARPISGSGVLVYLTGVAQKRKASSTMQLSDCVLNAGTPSASVTDGLLNVGVTKSTKAPRKIDSTATHK